MRALPPPSRPSIRVPLELQNRVQALGLCWGELHSPDLLQRPALLRPTKVTFQLPGTVRSGHFRPPQRRPASREQPVAISRNGPAAPLPAFVRARDWCLIPKPGRLKPRALPGPVQSLQQMEGSASPFAAGLSRPARCAAFAEPMVLVALLVQYPAKETHQAQMVERRLQCRPVPRWRNSVRLLRLLRSDLPGGCPGAAPTNQVRLRGPPRAITELTASPLRSCWMAFRPQSCGQR